MLHFNHKVKCLRYTYLLCCLRRRFAVNKRYISILLAIMLFNYFYVLNLNMKSWKDSSFCCTVIEIEILFRNLNKKGEKCFHKYKSPHDPQDSLQRTNSYRPSGSWLYLDQSHPKWCRDSNFCEACFLFITVDIKFNDVWIRLMNSYNCHRIWNLLQFNELRSCFLRIL